MGSKNETATVNVNINGGQANTTIKEMEANVRRLRSEWRGATVGTAEYIEKSKQLKIANEALIQARVQAGLMKNSVSSLGSEFGALIGKLGLATAAFGLLKKVFVDSIADAMREESAQNRLTFALNGNKDAAKELMKWKDKLKSTTTFTEDEIYSAINYGLGLGHNVETTKKMVTAAMALNKASGDMVSVQTALTQIQGTLQGDLGRLKKYTGDLTAEQLKNGAAMDVLINRYGTFLTEGMDTMAGRVKTLKDNWEEFSERIGGYYLPMLTAIVAKFNELMSMGDEPKKVVKEDDVLGFIQQFSSATKEERQKMIKEVESQEKAYFEKWKKANAEKNEESKKVYSYWYSVAKEKYDKMMEIQKKDSSVVPGIGDPNDLKKKAAEYAKYMDGILKDLEDARANLIINERDRELKIEEIAYQRKLAQITGNTEKENELRLVLEAEYFVKRLDISQKYYDKEQKELEKIEQEKLKLRFQAVEVESNLSDQINDEIANRLQDEWDAEKMMMERTGQMTIEKRREILAQERDIQLAGVSGNAAAQLLIWEKYYQDLKTLNDDHFQQTLNNFNTAATTGINLLGAYYNYQATQDQIQLAGYEKTVQKKRKILDNDLNKGIISQAYYDEQIAKLENDLNNERKRIAIENAKRDMVMSMISVGIQEAVAIAAAIRLAAESSKTPIDLIINIIAAVGTVVGTFLTAYSKLEAAKAIQYADGKYDVMGASDGRMYHDVPYTGPATTGVYERPALIAERGGELVVDAPTTKNLQMNYPWVMEAINYARVPQYADGNYSQISPARASTARGSQGSDAELLAAINLLNYNLSGGISAKIVYSDLETVQNTVNTIRNESRK